MSHSISSFVTAAQVNTIISKVDTVDAVVDAVKLKTDIIGASVALETGGNIAAIKTKTDATPQNVRGKLYNVNFSTALNTFQDVIDVTGHGKLYKLHVGLNNAADTVELKITYDGTVSNVFSLTGVAGYLIVIPSNLTIAPLLNLETRAMVDADINLFNLEFNASLLIQIRRSAGTASSALCQVSYNLDGF